MEKGTAGLFNDESLSWDVENGTSLSPAWYGLARTFPAVFDEPRLAHLQQEELKMTQMAAGALAAQAAVGDLYLSTLLRADATLAAVEQITGPLNSTAGLSALDEFRRTQRTRYLAHLSQIASRSATLILTEMR